MAKKATHGGARKGAGRKAGDLKEGTTQVVAASIPKGLISKLDALAKKNGWSRSQAITEAIRQFISK